ncbi:hypothetical protein [Streptomyces deserti]
MASPTKQSGGVFGEGRPQQADGFAGMARRFTGQVERGGRS